MLGNDDLKTTTFIAPLAVASLLRDQVKSVPAQKRFHLTGGHAANAFAHQTMISRVIASGPTSTASGCT